MRLRTMLVLALGAYVLLRSRRAPFISPVPQSAAPSSAVPDCTFPTGGNPVLTTVDNSTTGGFHQAPTIIVDAAVKMTLTSSLTLIADDRLEFNGQISMGAAPQPVNLTLVCRNGPVVIGPQAQIGVPPNTAETGLKAVVRNNAALAIAGAGVNGGVVKLIALQGSIDVRSFITGQHGGEGGFADARGVGPNGTAAAATGQPGAGGDVVLCAFEAIKINIAAGVQAGHGGEYGTGWAIAVHGQRAEGVGAPGNRGGNVYFHGIDPACQVNLNAQVSGGQGSIGGSCDVTGGNGDPSHDGGDAKSVGGNGGAGGSVFFDKCSVPAPAPAAGGNVTAGAGGLGGGAYGKGGNGGGVGVVLAFGLPALRVGDGGKMEGYAGDAGTAGALPKIPLTDGTTVQGTRPAPTPGEDASIRAGDGGPGGPILGFGIPAPLAGGSTGTAIAQGGAGETTRAKPPVTTALPIAAAPVGGSPGALAVTIVSKGTP